MITKSMLVLFLNEYYNEQVILKIAEWMSDGPLGYTLPPPILEGMALCFGVAWTLNTEYGNHLEKQSLFVFLQGPAAAWAGLLGDLWLFPHLINNDKIISTKLNYHGRPYKDLSYR
jgi:hypothetical protein